MASPAGGREIASHRGVHHERKRPAYEVVP